MGLWGNGKSTFLKAIARILEEYSEHTEGRRMRLRPTHISAMEVAINCVQFNGCAALSEYGRDPLLVIDDLGAELPEVDLGGVRITPMEHIIMSRYTNDLPTLISTNLDSKSLKKTYDPRIIDRLAEMTTTISFLGESFR